VEALASETGAATGSRPAITHGDPVVCSSASTPLCLGDRSRSSTRRFAGTVPMGLDAGSWRAVVQSMRREAARLNYYNRRSCQHHPRNAKRHCNIVSAPFRSRTRGTYDFRASTTAFVRRAYTSPAARNIAVADSAVPPPPLPPCAAFGRLPHPPLRPVPFTRRTGPRGFRCGSVSSSQQHGSS
jgi:hypothetical protein